MAGKPELAKEYLRKHKIMELLDNLTAQLIYERPGKTLSAIFITDFCQIIVRSITKNDREILKIH